jgi:hypothetical protein
LESTGSCLSKREILRESNMKISERMGVELVRLMSFGVEPTSTPGPTQLPAHFRMLPLPLYFHSHSYSTISHTLHLSTAPGDIMNTVRIPRTRFTNRNSNTLHHLTTHSLQGLPHTHTCPDLHPLDRTGINSRANLPESNYNLIFQT